MPSDRSKPQPAPEKAGPRVRGRSALLAHAMAQRENRLSVERTESRSKLKKARGDERPRVEERHRDDDQPRDDGRFEPDRAPSRAAVADDRPARPPRGPQPSAVAELNRPKPRDALIAEAMRARRPNGEPGGLDAMVAEALGKSAGRHAQDGEFDRQAALTDLIARTQARLGTGRPAASQPAAAPAPAAPDVPAKSLDREAAIAAAMRTHRERQSVFDDLTVRQRTALRAAAEAMVNRRGG